MIEKNEKGEINRETRTVPKRENEKDRGTK